VTAAGMPPPRSRSPHEPAEWSVPRKAAKLPLKQYFHKSRRDTDENRSTIPIHNMA
jgi:hypothetical protein